MISDHLIRNLKDIYNGNPWLGDSLYDKVNKLSPDQRFAKPYGLHSIFELIGHMLAWREFLLKKLEGDVGFRIQDDTEEAWPVEEENDSGWFRRINAFEQNQTALLVHLANLDTGSLEAQVPGYRYNFEYLIEGIIQHDAYHVGQIGLVMRLTTNKGI